MSTTRHVLAGGNFSQNWSNGGLITASDDWSGVPSIVGYRGDNLTAVTATDPQTILADGSGTPVDVNANQSNPDTFTTGGVAEFDTIPNPAIALNGSGTAGAPHIVLYMNSTGRRDVTLSFNARDLDASIDNAVQQIAVQYRVGNTGDFTNVPAGFIADATTPGTATQVTAISVTLPGDANDKADLQIRILTANATGNDEWVGIDDIAVSSAPAVFGKKNDFNADGHSDILWRNDNGAASIWDSGTMGGAHVISGAGVVPNSWHIAGKGDFDGNGQSDILWRNDNGAVSIWDNGAMGGAHVISGAGVVGNTWHISGIGDFDGNGQSDILWRNDNGAVSIWDNGAIGGAHVISGAGVVGNTWHISGTGDFNGDGTSDILWRHDNGAVSIWDSGAIGGAHVISGAGVVTNAWHISGTGDFDGNGLSDILWRNDNGAVSIWDNGAIGGARIIAGAGVLATAWHISDVADYDGNGLSDILWRHDNSAASIWDNGAIGGAHVISGAGVVPNDWHIA